MLTDTHCHFEDERYDDDREAVMEANLSELLFAVNATADPDKLSTVAGFTQVYEKIYAGLGIHPHYSLKFMPDEARDLIQAAISEAASGKVVAIGECGLDYYFDNQDTEGRNEYEVREAQADLLRAQLTLASQHQLPVIIHCRDTQDGWDAYQDVFEIMAESDVESGVIHSFSGPLQFARQFTEAGFYLGISGILTFDKTKKLAEVVKEIELEKILLETDAPYLTPVPHRGKRNEPRYTQFIAQEIATIKNISVEEVLEVTEANARNLFGIEVE